jgi:AraC family transcriptional activator of pyochelin receptor
VDRQLFFPRNVPPHDIATIRAMGPEHSEGVARRSGQNWTRTQVCRDPTFTMVALEDYRVDADDIGYTRQEDYVKINFWLAGRHTTVLDGFGQYQHQRPEVYMTSGPWDMIKVDVLSRETQTCVVSLCLLSEFFQTHLGIFPQELPEPLRAMFVPGEKPFAFHRFPLTPDLVAATRAILAAPFAVRCVPLYAQSKSIELMCLLIHNLQTGSAPLRSVSVARHEGRLYAARELLMRRYSENLTLQRISKEVGLNRLALTSGFQNLFGTSVYDMLQKVRMERAFELLQDNSLSVATVAYSVGFSHACNFSTAFHSYFGCSPQKARKFS